MGRPPSMVTGGGDIITLTSGMGYGPPSSSHPRPGHGTWLSWLCSVDSVAVWYGMVCHSPSDEIPPFPLARRSKGILPRGGRVYPEKEAIVL